MTDAIAQVDVTVPVGVQGLIMVIPSTMTVLT